jgi:hypothetical protein
MGDGLFISYLLSRQKGKGVVYGDGKSATRYQLVIVKRAREEPGCAGESNSQLMYGHSTQTLVILLPTRYEGLNAPGATGLRGDQH